MKFSEMTKKQQNRKLIRMQNASSTFVKKAVLKADLLKKEAAEEAAK